MSFQISLKPQRQAATDFIAVLRRKLKTAIAEAHESGGANQSEIAQRLGIHRSVISRELNGSSDITAGRIAEIAWAIGREVEIDFPVLKVAVGANFHVDPVKTEPFRSTAETYTFPVGDGSGLRIFAAQKEPVND